MAEFGALLRDSSVRFYPLGDIEQARAAIAEAQKLSPGLTVGEVANHVPFKRPQDLEHYLDGLRKAGLPE